MDTKRILLSVLACLVFVSTYADPLLPWYDAGGFYRRDFSGNWPSDLYWLPIWTHNVYRYDAARDVTIFDLSEQVRVSGWRGWRTGEWVDVRYNYYAAEGAVKFTQAESLGIGPSRWVCYSGTYRIIERPTVSGFTWGVDDNLLGTMRVVFEIKGKHLRILSGVTQRFNVLGEARQ